MLKEQCSSKEENSTFPIDYLPQYLIALKMPSQKCQMFENLSHSFTISHNSSLIAKILISAFNIIANVSIMSKFLMDTLMRNVDINVGMTLLRLIDRSFRVRKLAWIYINGLIWYLDTSRMVKRLNHRSINFIICLIKLMQV